MAKFELLQLIEQKAYPQSTNPERLPEDKRGFSEIVDSGIKNEMTRLGLRDGSWRSKVAPGSHEKVIAQLNELSQLLKEKNMSYVLKLDGTLSDFGLNRVINIVWDSHQREKNKPEGGIEALKPIALALEKLGKIISEELFEKPVQKNTEKSLPKANKPKPHIEDPDPIALTSKVERDIKIMQELMDKHAKGKAPVTAREIVEICQKHGVDYRLAFLMFWKESHWGRFGRAARTFNPGNVGNTDSGASRHMGDRGASTKERFLAGVSTWCDFMKKGYPTTLEGFIENGGKRSKGRSIGAAYASRGYTRWLKDMSEIFS